MREFIQRTLRNNTVALGLTSVVANIARLGVNLLLARLLFPEAFAVVGIIGSIVFMIELFSDFGFHAYIVRHVEGEDRLFLDTIWSIRLVRGVVLAFLMVGLSSPIASYVDHPEMQPAIIVSSIVFLLIGIESLGEFSSDRRNKVAKPLYIDLLAYSISAVFTIGMAFYIESYWALIYGLIASSFLKTLFSYTMYKDSTRKFKIDFGHVPEFFNFAKIILPSSIITVFLVQGDKAIVAKTLSFSELGLYYIAFNLSSSALALTTTYPRRILYPVLAEAYRTNPGKLKEIYYENKSLVLAGLCFLLGGLSGSSVLFFDILYDDRYQSAATYLSILLIHPILCTLSVSAESCLVATGKFSVALVANILRLLWVLLGALIGYRLYGSVGVVVAFATVETLPIFYLFLELRQKGVLNLSREVFNLISATTGFIIGLQGSKLILSFIQA